jgi:hypothetical protein
MHPSAAEAALILLFSGTEAVPFPAVPFHKPLYKSIRELVFSAATPGTDIVIRAET